MYKIEKGIEVTPMRRGRPRKYPVKEMKVGDSFFVPKANSEFQRYVSRLGKQIGGKFISRVVDGGVRVWRVE